MGGRTRPPYPPEFREQIVQLVWVGRSPEELAEEFEPSARLIRNWVVQADLDEGRTTDGLTTQEREDLCRVSRQRPSKRRRAPGDFMALDAARSTRLRAVIL